MFLICQHSEEKLAFALAVLHSEGRNTAYKWKQRCLETCKRNTPQ
ncbi:unnamed protein product [Linum tenue]|uniref:Uncharacterized protein n=1 Tax=Linum tenue TaxID=586396 RepID=A0AAV0JKQ2_9ROSI|nr:unnamed protein product [Linum tenue]